MERSNAARGASARPEHDTVKRSVTAWFGLSLSPYERVKKGSGLGPKTQAAVASGNLDEVKVLP